MKTVKKVWGEMMSTRITCDVGHLGRSEILNFKMYGG